MKTVFILCDSLNRHFLSCYGAKDPILAPNIERLAARGVVFDNHFCGSSPCMPARRDILTGRLNFLERPWGGIEPYDHTLPALLAEKNVYTHMETDHFHYAERGGENYWGHFTSWNLHRGTEFDTIHWGPDKNGIPPTDTPEGYTGRYGACYEATKAAYDGQPDRYSTPRTFTAAADWLDRHHDADNFLLWVEGFDPHEPFDVPQKYIDLYEDVMPEEGDPYWPDYIPSEGYTAREIAYFRRRYKALVTMTDEYLGRLLDVLDKHDLWQDTMVVLTTDHGFLLGEHGFMAKCYMPDYNEIHRIPLIVAAPGAAPARCKALTENIDLFPTFLENFGVPLSACRNAIHGKSLHPLLRGETNTVRDALIYGVFGKTVNIYDGQYTYLRRPKDNTNEPLHIYGAMMTMLNQYIGYDGMSEAEIGRIEMGRYLSWTNYPVYRVRANECHWTNNAMAFERILNYVPENLLFDLHADPGQHVPIKDAALEKQLCNTLVRTMRAHDCPEEQFVRLGLSEETTP